MTLVTPGADAMTTTMNTEPTLVRLGDVAAFLQPGDRFEHEGTEYSVVENEATNKLVHLRRLWNGGDQGGFCGLHSWQVRLISPRLVPVPVGETIPAGVPWGRYNSSVGGWTGPGLTPDAVGVMVDDSAFAAYKLVRSRLATRADVREGMRVRLKDADGETTHEGVVTRCEKNSFRVDGVLLGRCRYATLPVEILAEPEPREQLPREVKGSELRLGDRYKYPSFTAEFIMVREPSGEDCGIDVVAVAAPDEGWNVAGQRSKSPSPDHDVVLLSRNNPIPSQPPPATEPAKAEEAARCLFCKQPFWAGRVAVTTGICGDCRQPPMRLDIRIAYAEARARNRQPVPEPNPHGANRANFLHHLRDDVDVWGV